MTPTQQNAKKALESMAFRFQKADKYDQEKTLQKQKETPELAVILDEQLKDRMEQRQARIDTFSKLLKEAIDATDKVQSMYQGFKHACVAKDIFSVTDNEMDLMSANQLLVCQFSKVWRTYFPEMSRQHAVYHAIEYGNPHTFLLFHTSEPIQPDGNRPRKVKIKRKWKQLSRA